MLALDGASDCVDVLIEEGWAQNQIALLTTKRTPFSPSGSVRIQALPECWQTFHDDDEEFCGHILRFNNLERAVVILCVNGFKDVARAPEQFHVRLSRGARCLLTVVWDRPVALARAETWVPVQN